MRNNQALDTVASALWQEVKDGEDGGYWWDQARVRAILATAIQQARRESCDEIDRLKAKWAERRTNLIVHYEQQLAEARRAGMEEAAKLIETDPDNYTVQNCCICYGGSSFPGPIKDVLMCHNKILASRCRAQAAKETP